jgi:hypothetical protein
MHRSGTSFAARSLELMGVDFGVPDQLMGPGPDNPTGYWENRFVKELNDELLAHLGGSWDQPPALLDGWESDPGLDPFRDRATEVLAAAFGAETGSSGWIAWKDPRLSILLPFWRSVTPITATVSIVRDPLEVAASLQRRNDMPSSQACLLWLRYVLACAASDPGQLVLRHQDFFEDLPQTMARIARHLQVPEPDDSVIRAGSEHLDPELRHHRSDRAADAPDPLTALALAVWDGGDVSVDLVPPVVAVAIAGGWMRPPADTEALDRARAKVVELTERLRRRARQRKAAAAKAGDADD